MLIELILFILVALFVIYRWATVNNDFFAKRGIAFHKPYPIFGSFLFDLLLQRKNILDLVRDYYRMHDGKAFGLFDQRSPLFLIRDPDLIKQITIKDFDHFVNHRAIFGDSDGNIFANSLFFMSDGTWKDMRSTLSPAFTGSKLRQMFQLINEVAQHSVKYLTQECGMNTKEGLELDVKDFCTRFTNDVIASTAFGLQVNSFENKENEFYIAGKKVTTFKGFQNVKFIFYAIFPKLAKLLKMSLLDKASTEYFTRLTLDTMNYRSEHNIFRPDMINLLMEARGMTKSEGKKTHNREWSDMEIVAQTFLFFFAGFDSTATLLCFTAHELMENPEVQEKLLLEIQEVDKELEGNALTYEALQGMEYMDMVTSEALRKWPSTVAIDRQCSKDFLYEADGERIEIRKGENLWLPVCGIHHDPKYYENPDQFDPERFSEENKDKIQPFTYFPFGLGPRNCIGSRFALLEIKAFLYYLVLHFRIEVSKKTTQPLKLVSSGFVVGPKNGFWLQFIPRDQA